MSRSLKNKPGPFAWVEVDLKKLASNYRSIHNYLRKTSGASVLAVVKADAYGHGMVPVASALWKAGVRFFGVANLDEARELRRCLKSARILVLGCFSAEQIPFFIQNNLTPTVSSIEDLLLLEKSCRKFKKRLAVHLKVDTGMGRLGFWYKEAGKFFDALKACEFVQTEGLYTHFSSADHEDEAPTQTQLCYFDEVLHVARVKGIQFRYIHSANSVGFSRFQKSHFNLVRPGILLYGVNPFGGHLPFKIKPILSLKAKITFVKDVEAGRSVSYGATFKSARKTRLAVLPIGYSHGYRVAYSNKAQAFVGSELCKVAGRVTMDQTLFEVSPKVRRWDTVTLISDQEPCRAEDLARLSGTIPYEVLCALHPRILRKFTA